MTIKTALLVSEIDHSYLRKKLEEYSRSVKGNHCPSLVYVIAVLKEIGLRQRKRKGFEVESANESLKQLSAATGISASSCSDVLRFAEWAGMCVTVRKGGGPKKTPTVRQLIAEGFPVARSRKQNGENHDQNGEDEDHNGVFPQTPKGIPIDSNNIFDTCESKLNSRSTSDTSETKHVGIEDDPVENKFFGGLRDSEAIVFEELSKLADSIPGIVDLDDSVDLSLLMADLVDGLSGFDWDI
jgi:hypothetical protein